MLNRKMISMKTQQIGKRVWILLVSVVLVGGCSKEEVDKMVADVKQSAGDLKSSANDALAKTKQAAQSVGDLAGATDFTGSASIKLDTATAFASSYIRLIPAGDGRPALLQIKSSPDGGPEKFPAFLVQGETDGQSLAGLNGKSIPVRVFVQQTEKGTVWSNVNSDPIMITIQQVDKRFVAKFEQGKLIDSVDESQIVTDGTFESVEF